jgi:hypothetical protein
MPELKEMVRSSEQKHIENQIENLSIILQRIELKRSKLLLEQKQKKRSWFSFFYDWCS